MNQTVHSIIFVLLCSTLFGQAVFADQSGPQDAYFRQISSLCGASFSGQAGFPEDPGDAWRGKKLVAHIEQCNGEEIRIPFIVGADHSRTWILRRVAGGLQLRHDHRHEDGSPDEVSLYGGTTQSAGSHLAQSFPADAYTADLIPEAATNEWFLSLNADGTELTYYLERHGLPRFRAVLHREFSEPDPHQSKQIESLEIPVALNRNKPEKIQNGSTVVKITGTFEVNLNPLDFHVEGVDGMSLGRMSIDKKFNGDLEATSKGEMLTAVTPVAGSAGYVAIEQVSGSLSGKNGSFVLQHSGMLDRGSDRLTLEVVPDSGTGELSGLKGEMKIRIEDGQHYYDFEYELE